MTRATGRTYRHVLELVADVHARRAAPAGDAAPTTATTTAGGT
jgi:hypothetical protein